MSSKTDREIRKAKELVEELRDLSVKMNKARATWEKDYDEIRRINRKINGIHKKNNVSDRDNISKQKIKKLYDEMSADELRKIYEKQKDNLSEEDKKFYMNLINSKQERA
jgi:DNA-directed RNA polymerase subunit F